MSPAAKRPSKRKSITKTTAKRASRKKTSAKKSTAARTAGRSAVARKATTKRVSAKKKAPKTSAARRRTGQKTVASKTPVRRRRAARIKELDAGALAEIRRRLEGEYADLERQWEAEEASFEVTQSDLTGEVGLDEDFADAGTATFERERDLSIQNNIRDLMGQIRRAIARIDQGSYGKCERCGQAMEAARLRALPHASLCMDCKRSEERTR